MRVLAALAAFVVCTAAIPARAMTVSFSWGPTKKCFDRNSPPIRISGVPTGTRRLDFVMRDLDAPNFQHGGGSVRYRGQTSLGYGAFHYKGPCPPEPHSYEISVTAVDASGKTLAAASARRTFPGD